MSDIALLVVSEKSLAAVSRRKTQIRIKERRRLLFLNAFSDLRFLRKSAADVLLSTTS